MRKLFPKIVRESKEHIVALSFIIAIVVSTSVFVSLNQKPKIVKAAIVAHAKSANKVDLHIAQYSDQHITENAIDSNGRFSSLTLANYIQDDSQFFSPQRQVAGVGNAFNQSAMEYGTWIWTPVMDMTSAYMDQIISGAKSKGINVIYVSIDSYLDVYVQPLGTEKEKAKKAYVATLEDFVSRATKAHIAVDAEAGWRNWGEDGNAYKGFAIVNFVKEFNRNEKYTIHGFQYDVEPYLLASYQTNQSGVLKNYVALVDQTTTLLGQNDLKFSVVVPDFYDHDAGLTKPFEYNGITAYAYDHIVDVLDTRPNSSVIVMSYRNFAEGDDGAIDISNNEINDASNNIHTTKVIIAQETGDVQPAYITYNNTSEKYYTTQIDDIRTAFQNYPNFGGIAVHYVNSFLSL